MRIPTLFRGTLVALIALFSVGLHSAKADTGSITRSAFAISPTCFGSLADTRAQILDTLAWRCAVSSAVG